MTNRNRAQGWQHAKLSGHKNEDLAKHLLDIDKKYAQEFICRLGYKDYLISNTNIGGIHDTKVTSVCGNRKTTSKTDLKVSITNNNSTDYKTINISIKKSLTGQVYFVTPNIFIDTYEYLFNKKIPPNVIRAIKLFWADAEDALDIIDEYADFGNQKNFNLQIKHKSLNATTLRAYNRTLYHELLQWFCDNSYNLCKICFSTGSVKNPSEWAEYVWYKNLVDNTPVIDDLISIEDICIASHEHAASKTSYGTSNGGTTINLPFGFVQWHQGKLQFHHDYNKIKALLF